MTSRTSARGQGKPASWAEGTAARSYGRRFGRRPIDPKHAATEREWYKKLADSGFEDIEVYGADHNTYLRQHYLEVRNKVIRGVETGTAELMRMAEEWLDIERWKTRTERWTWAAWCKSGWTIDEIAARWPSMDVAASGLRSRFERRVVRMRGSFATRVEEEELLVDQ